MYHKEENKKFIIQGDIFRSFTYVRWAKLNTSSGNVDIDEIKIPFFVVLTQACDLKQDFQDRSKKESEKRDKYIESVLVCPAYIATSVKTGSHLKELKIQSESYNRDRWKIIEKNNNPRYHFLKENPSLKIPNLVIDFKQYYTIPTQILYELFEDHYLGALQDLFKEDLSQRFASYLSRIGLPVTKVITSLPTDPTSQELQ